MKTLNGVLKANCEKITKEFHKAYPHLRVYSQVKMNVIKTGYDVTFIQESDDMEFRSIKKGSRWKPLYNRMITLTCDINPNGITGPDDIAMTFTIHSFGNLQPSCYCYSKTMNGALKKYKKWIKTTLLDWLVVHEFRS